MTRIMYWMLVPVLAWGFLMTSTTEAPAQSQKRKIMIIRDFSVNDVRSPIYEVKPDFRQEIREWKQLETEYATDPDWLDEVTFIYYVLLKNPDNAEPDNPRAAYTLLKGEVTNVNVAEGGDHYSVMYIHPSTVERYGEIDRVAVIARADGTTAAMKSIPDSNIRWWEEVAPLTGLLHNRLETPYAMIAYDRYEAIKANVAGR